MDDKNNVTYSIDYNQDVLSLRPKHSYKTNSSKVVTASSPTLKKFVNEKNKIKEKALISDTPMKTENRGQFLNSDDIYIKAKSNKKILLYKILYCCFILLFSSIGLYIFSSMLFNESTSVDVSSSYKNEYYQLLSPVVMNDPMPFDSPANADIQMVISSSIWKLITENGTQKYNQFDERGLSLIPKSDIIKASKELFGENYNLNLNESIFGSFFTFYCGEENFHISAISNQNACIPFIKELTELDDEVNLTVAYISRDDKFLKSGSEKADEPSPIKYMRYTFKKNNDTSFYIYSVENV